MNATFDMPNVRLSGFILSALLTLAVFAILPLSILAAKDAKKVPEYKVVKVVSLKNVAASKKTPANSKDAREISAAPSPSERGVGMRSLSSLVSPNADILGVPEGAGAGADIGNFALNDFGGADIGGEVVPFQLSELDRIPKRLNDVKVEYPKKLLERGVEGKVLLMLTILEDGSVQVDGVENSTDSRFDDCAAEAASRMKFEIPTKGGKPVRAKFVLPMPFKILK